MIVFIDYRNLNQDGLENFFGCVRSQCHNSSSLIVPHFRSAYASTFVTNANSVHSMKSNCEADIYTPLLTNVHRFFLDYISSEQKNDLNDSNSTDLSDDENEPEFFDPLHNFNEKEITAINDEAASNDASLVCDKMMKMVKCKKCRKTIESKSPNQNYDELDAPKKPSDVFQSNFRILICGINDILPDICTEKLLRHKLMQQLDKIEIESIGCSEHCEYVTSKLIEQTAFYGIVSFTKNINDLLSGKNTTPPHVDSYLERLAYTFKQKNKGIGKHSEKSKSN